jgi:RecA/RadA recombinase
MAKQKIIEEKKPTEVGLKPEDILDKHLKTQKEYHLNYESEVYYRFSTGSLKLDIETGGGLMPGIHRSMGIYEGGKTSFSLECMKNFLKTVKGSRGLYVKAEGRLSAEMRERSGVTFVTEAKDWVDGTCFILETNVYEVVINIMRELVRNKNGTLYYFLLDSMDGLVPKNDFDKEVDEANKVAGAPALTKKFLQKLGGAMQKFGHVCMMIGQVSANIQLDEHTKNKGEQRKVSATGGNAALHWANFIFEFEPRADGLTSDDLIRENQAEKYDPVKNKLIGHYCKIRIRKSTNEKTNSLVKYPIKYGRNNGTSVWREYEVIEMLEVLGLVTRSGAWYYFDPEIIKDIKAETGIEAPEKTQGKAKVFEFLDSNSSVTTYLHNRFVAMYSAQAA